MNAIEKPNTSETTKRQLNQSQILNLHKAAATQKMVSESIQKRKPPTTVKLKK
jgi:hypothetical protein